MKVDKNAGIGKTYNSDYQLDVSENVHFGHDFDLSGDFLMDGSSYKNANRN